MTPRDSGNKLIGIHFYTQHGTITKQVYLAAGTVQS